MHEYPLATFSLPNTTKSSSSSSSRSNQRAQPVPARNITTSRSTRNLKTAGNLSKNQQTNKKDGRGLSAQQRLTPQPQIMQKSKSNTQS